MEHPIVVFSIGRRADFCEYAFKIAAFGFYGVRKKNRILRGLCQSLDAVEEKRFLMGRKSGKFFVLNVTWELVGNIGNDAKFISSNSQFAPHLFALNGIRAKSRTATRGEGAEKIIALFLVNKIQGLADAVGHQQPLPIENVRSQY